MRYNEYLQNIIQYNLCISYSLLTGRVNYYIPLYSTKRNETDHNCVKGKIIYETFSNFYTFHRIAGNVRRNQNRFNISKIFLHRLALLPLFTVSSNAFSNVSSKITFPGTWDDKVDITKYNIHRLSIES